MSFLAGLLPAIGGILPGIVSTVGKVVGKIGQGDWGGALGEVGKALTGQGAQDTSKQVAEGIASAELQKQKEKAEAERLANAKKLEDEELERQRKRKQEEFEIELANKKKLADLQFELESRKLAGANRLGDYMPIWRGRGPVRVDQREAFASVPLRPAGIELRPDQDMAAMEELEYEEDQPLVRLPPRPRRKNKRDKKKRRNY